MGKAFDRVIDAFHAQGLKVKTNGHNGATAQAPGHSNADQSVSITDIGGRVLVWSHSDPTDDVLAALNLSMTDLFDEPKGITYEYSDGRRVSRTPHKKFHQSGNTSGDQLYRAERLADAQIVFIAEGEQDVHALESIGVTAACTAMGAGKAHKFDLSPLRGKTVFVIRDMDEPGLNHAQQIKDLLDGIADVRILEPAIGKDAADHIAAGFGVDDFIDHVPVDTEFEAEVEAVLRKSRVVAEAKRREHGAPSGPKLNPKSLGDVLSMEFTHDWLVPDLLERQDRLVLTGTEGTGKSHLLRQIAITTAAGVHPFNLNHHIEPLRVLVVDAENSEQQWGRSARYVARLVAGKGAGDPLTNVTVSAGTRLDFTRQHDVDEVHALIDQHNPDIVYIGPLYKLVPKEISTDDDAAPLIVALDSFRERGVTLLMEAHAGHGKGYGGERDLRPRGSSALMGWPEFGMGLRPFDDDDSMVAVVKWRGDREQRDWPKRLRRGVDGELPWESAW